MVCRRGRRPVLVVKGLPPIRIRTSRPLPDPAALKTVRIVRKPVRTEIHLCYGIAAAAPAPAEDAAPSRPVGIDVGVARRLTLSTGEALARRDPDRRRLRRLQRRVTRATRHSGSRRTAVQAVGRAWQRIRDADRQALHRVAHALCRRFDGFAVEDLDVRNLTRSANGTVAAPGTRVQQKRGLNRAIADQGWSAFVTILKDQAASAGLPVIAVPGARHQPAVLAMRRHRAQDARRPPAPVPALRARPRPRPQRGHQHPAAGLARPPGGPDGSSVSRGYGRTGRAPRPRTKRGAGPARGMTVSMSSHGYKPLTESLAFIHGYAGKVLMPTCTAQVGRPSSPNNMVLLPGTIFHCPGRVPGTPR